MIHYGNYNRRYIMEIIIEDTLYKLSLYNRNFYNIESSLLKSDCRINGFKLNLY